MPRPILTIDAVRVRRAPLYDDDRLLGFAVESPPEVRGTLYFANGSTMKLFQTLTPEEQAELEALLSRVSARVLSLMTVALSQEEMNDPRT